MKIPIKKYVMDESLSWEERYKQLEAHHKEEVGWFINKVKELELEKLCLYDDIGTLKDKLDDYISSAEERSL